MAKPLVTDELWEMVEPLLPPEPTKPKGGRPRLSDRAAPALGGGAYLRLVGPQSPLKQGLRGVRRNHRGVALSGVKSALAGSARLVISHTGSEQPVSETADALPPIDRRPGNKIVFI